MPRANAFVVSTAPVLALGLFAGSASAQWTNPPAYTMPGAPTSPRAGTVAAIADNTNQANVYGPAVTFGRSAGGSYAGIGTTVTSATTAVQGTVTPIYGTGRPYFGSSAWLRAGLVSGNATVSMEWRTATQQEFYGTSVGTTANPGPMPDSGPWNTLGSDVLHLSGISATGSLNAGRLPTDAYTLEMTFDPNIIVAGYQNFDTYGWTINNIIAAGELQMAHFDTITGVWSKGIDVINAGASRHENYMGTWDAFAAQYGVTDANLSSFVGSYGIVIDSQDPTNSRIWSVLDHTSLYSVVPAPGAAALVGVASLITSRRRRA
ncbi:MAG: hypothetical protein ACKPEA_19250 [Planctomycetota bacterium]